MQIKKEIVLFCALILLSISLLIAASPSSDSECIAKQGNELNCSCEEKMKDRAESPWNFITSGIFHFSA
ncbi:MAG: hypothetical protein ABIN36_17885 [Ferruginibacter sp.]